MTGFSWSTSASWTVCNKSKPFLCRAFSLQIRVQLMKARHKDTPDLLLGFGEALGGLFDVLLSKHKLVPAVQSFTLVGVRSKRFCGQSRGLISNIQPREVMGHPPDCVMRAA